MQLLTSCQHSQFSSHRTSMSGWAHGGYTLSKRSTPAKGRRLGFSAPFRRTTLSSRVIPTHKYWPTYSHWFGPRFKKTGISSPRRPFSKTMVAAASITGVEWGSPNRISSGACGFIFALGSKQPQTTSPLTVGRNDRIEPPRRLLISCREYSLPSSNSAADIVVKRRCTTGDG